MMPQNRPAVLILSTNPAFARELAAQWPVNPGPPEFTVLGEMLVHDLTGSQYDLAIADASSPESHSVFRKLLAAAAKPAILIHTSPAPLDHALVLSPPERNIVELYRDAANPDNSSASQPWAKVAGLLGREILRRSQAEARQDSAECLCATAAAEATLGRYMVEMRHNVNNALTSILGNAELLTVEPGLPASVLAQADTIRNMALRLHEVFQRFSSIEKELFVVARESSKQPRARSAASGA
jgi:signal transduction histidine kinase